MSSRSNAPRRLAALCLGALLAACGGGGDGDSSDNTAAADNSVYATPSAAGCDPSAAVAGCTPPTSSQLSVEALVAGFKDPSGTAYRFDAIGWELDSFQTFADTRFVSGVASYALVEEPLVIGRNQVKDASRSYAYSRDLNTGSVEFGSTGKTIQIGLFQNGPAFGAIRNDLYEDGVVVNAAGANGNHGVKTWHPNFGLLTDTRDAPKEAVLDYTGSVSVIAGDGSVAPSSFPKVVSGGCPITLTLDSVNGTLSTTPATCTDAQTRAAIQFSLARLFFKGARVSAALGSEAGIAIDAPLIGKPELGQVTLNFSSARVSGALFDAAAKVVVVSGSSPSGAFQIIATRP